MIPDATDAAARRRAFVCTANSARSHLAAARSRRGQQRPGGIGRDAPATWPA
jgi:hypothetical protein